MGTSVATFLPPGAVRQPAVLQVWCRMAATAHFWVGLLTVGGMVGGSHCQLPLLAIQEACCQPQSTNDMTS